RLHAVFAAVDRADKPFHAVPNIEQQYAALAALEHEQQRHKDTLEAEVATAAGPELAKIDQRLREMQKRPGDLPAEYSYHSQLAADPDTIKWAQVDLQAAQDVAE